MKDYMNVHDVMTITGASKATAYNILHAVNEELREKGYIVLRGKAPAIYVRKRLGLPVETQAK